MRRPLVCVVSTHLVRVPHDPSAVAAHLRRIADALALAAASEQRTQDDARLWTHDGAQVLKAVAYKDREYAGLASVRLETAREDGAHSAIRIGHPLVGKGLLDVLAEPRIVADLSLHADLAADTIEGGPHVTEKEWTDIVAAVVTGRLTNTTGAVLDRFHTSSSPITRETLSESSRSSSAPAGGGLKTLDVPSSGLPEAMLLDLRGSTVEPRLHPAVAHVPSNRTHDPVATLRAIANLTRITGWTPPSGSKGRP